MGVTYTSGRLDNSNNLLLLNRVCVKLFCWWMRGWRPGWLGVRFLVQLVKKTQHSSEGSTLPPQSFPSKLHSYNTFASLSSVISCVSCPLWLPLQGTVGIDGLTRSAVHSCKCPHLVAPHSFLALFLSSALLTALSWLLPLLVFSLFCDAWHQSVLHCRYSHPSHGLNGFSSTDSASQITLSGSLLFLIVHSL